MPKSEKQKLHLEKLAKKNTTKETLIQTVIEQYLAYQENLGKLCFQKNNSGALPTAQGSWIRFGKAGAPDFIIWLPQGKNICLEVKNETGKLSPIQKKFRDKITKLGYEYFIVRSVDEAEKIINRILLPTP